MSLFDTLKQAAAKVAVAATGFTPGLVAEAMLQAMQDHRSPYDLARDLIQKFPMAGEHIMNADAEQFYNFVMSDPATRKQIAPLVRGPLKRYMADVLAAAKHLYAAQAKERPL